LCGGCDIDFQIMNVTALSVVSVLQYNLIPSGLVTLIIRKSIAIDFSCFPDRDLTTSEGVLAALEYETLDEYGIIRGTWMEHIESAFDRSNEKMPKISCCTCANTANGR